MKKHNFDLDSAIEENEERERRLAMRGAQQNAVPSKVLVGVVEKYFSKLGVAAVNLQANLSVGDIIEIGNEEEAIRQRIKSMQINRNDVSKAGAGDSVGILVKYPVEPGTKVYKLLNDV
ncbi:MAG: hypothetical protein QXW10_00355 [Candidatus Micrarchaeaceae archaeon]